MPRKKSTVSKLLDEHERTKARIERSKLPLATVESIKRFHSVKKSRKKRSDIIVQHVINNNTIFGRTLEKMGVEREYFKMKKVIQLLNMGVEGVLIQKSFAVEIRNKKCVIRFLLQSCPFEKKF